MKAILSVITVSTLAPPSGVPWAYRVRVDFFAVYPSHTSHWSLRTGVQLSLTQPDIFHVEVLVYLRLV